MLQSLKVLALGTCILSGTAMSSRAQTYTSPVATEYTYGSTSVREAVGTAAYSAGLISTAYGLSDMYLSAWYPKTGAKSEVTWQFMQPGTTTIQDQGSFMYNNVINLEVAAVNNGSPGQSQIMVAYYKLGVGHFVDLYDITNMAFTPVMYSHTVQLSNSAEAGRIRIDGSYQQMIAITWEYPGIGIQSCALDYLGNWGAVRTFSNTEYQHEPDVAVIYHGGTDPVSVHYVYHNGDGIVTESKLSWNTLMNAASTTLSPTVEDVNVLPSPIGNPVIDCPDLCEQDNWAYTYTEGRYVYVRFMDYYSTATPTTVNLSSGALGNVAMNIHETFSPSIHYGLVDQYGIHPTDNITVAWYATDLNTEHHYVGVQMTADGTTLLNSLDYMAMPNGATADRYPIRPGIALSKSDPQLAPEFMYATYYDYDPITDNYNLHHAYHSWGNTVFKGAKAMKAVTHTYPNPFSNTINTSVTLNEAGVAVVELYDITGKMAAQTRRTLTAGTHSIQLNGLQDITPGVYFMNTTVNGRKTASTTVVKQQ